MTDCLEKNTFLTAAYRTQRVTMEEKLERVKGIEPSYAAWEAAVLPLNYTREGAHSMRLSASVQSESEKSRLTRSLL